MKDDFTKHAGSARKPGGWAGWLLERIGKGFRKSFRADRRPAARLSLVDRIALAPRQSLALVEVEGRRFLVATSAEGAPAFCALDGTARAADRHGARVSW